MVLKAYELLFRLVFHCEVLEVLKGQLRVKHIFSFWQCNGVEERTVQFK